MLLRKITPPDYTESSWAVLALVRFCLSLIVFLSHLQYFANVSKSISLVYPLGGKAAVLGFFLISGFSVGHSYAQKSAGYFQRRFLRIYPLYFISVTFAIVLVNTIGSPYELPGRHLLASGWKTDFANFFFLQGFVAIPIMYNPVLWSLSYEVFYYLLLPLLCRAGTALLVPMVVGSMILFYRFPNAFQLAYGAAVWIWPWLIGLLLSTKKQYGLFALLAILGTIVTLFSKAITTEPLSWLTFSSVAGVVFFAGHLKLNHQIRTAMNYLGEISYPFYLFHFPLCLALFRYAGIRHAWQLVGLTLLCTILLNYVFDHWLKAVFWKPMLRAATSRMLKAKAITA